MIGETYKFNYLKNCKIAEIVERIWIAKKSCRFYKRADALRCLWYKKKEADNHFEKLYFECIEESCTRKTYNYHYDVFVGYVGYDVELSNFGINHRFLSPTYVYTPVGRKAAISPRNLCALP
jgi:hypothetical protein